MELPSYLAKASQVNSENDNFDVLKWWQLHENELPGWASEVILVQPSSAASERVFPPLLQNSFDEKQLNCLEYYIEASLMLQYNSR